MIKRIYISYWGGCEDVHIVDTLHYLPKGCRYVCSMDKENDGYDLHIYEGDDGTVYGVKEL